MERHLALELAVTIRHDGHGGVLDELAWPSGLTAWVRDRADLLAADLRAERFEADERVHREAVAVREAVRALFARAVRPAPASSADAARLLPAGAAVERLNAAVARVPAVPVLVWPEDGEPVVDVRSAALGGDPADRLAAALARAAIGFLAGPGRIGLRACPAPRCVRYFVKAHPRQEWCGPSCGNRARVARHYERRRAAR